MSEGNLLPPVSRAKLNLGGRSSRTRLMAGIHGRGY